MSPVANSGSLFYDDDCSKLTRTISIVIAFVGFVVGTRHHYHYASVIIVKKYQRKHLFYFIFSFCRISPLEDVCQAV